MCLQCSQADPLARGLQSEALCTVAIKPAAADEEKHDAARAVQASQATASEAEVSFE